MGIKMKISDVEKMQANKDVGFEGVINGWPMP